MHEARTGQAKQSDLSTRRGCGTPPTRHMFEKILSKSPRVLLCHGACSIQMTIGAPAASHVSFDY